MAQCCARRGKNSEHANENRSESVLSKQKRENDKNQRKKERKEKLHVYKT